MKRAIGAALAACALLWAGAASAAVVFFEEGTTTNGIYSGFQPTALGQYRLTITTDQAANLRISTYYEEHWDIFRAPAPRPHSEFIEGHSDPFYGTASIFGTTLTIDFLLPEPTIEYFLAGAQYESRGIPAGTELYREAWYHRADFTFRVRNDDNLTPFNYTITVAAIPEPSTWAIMIVGFGMAGTGLRQARRHTFRPV